MAAPEPLDLDPIEPEPEESTKQNKGKGTKPGKPVGQPKTNRAARDDDAEPRAPRKSVAGDRKVPYPSSPANVPDGLTDYADSYTKQQNLLLAGLFVFLVFYIGAVLFFAMIGIWCVWSFSHYPPLKVVGIVFSSIFFLYLVKGFFKSHPMNKEMHIEITEDEHPVLFEFIYQLCDELGAPLPNKVFVAPDVNAAVMPRTSLLNLFVEPKKDLLIGLGLVNSVNLSEFKAVLAHEFGHFGQSAMASSYTYVASRIIGDLVEGEDWFDRLVNWCKRQDNVFSVLGHVIGVPLWIGRKILEWFYKAITLQRLAVSREREFHADLVAVSAAGSNAVVHCLLRTEFGHQCFMQALNDLATALDHKLYSNDLYLHQDRAAAVVRRRKKEPELGMPPALKTINEGKNVEVFDAEEEEMEDEIPPMWRTHPSNSDREKNAKDQFVAAIADHRSPWILFDDAGELKERMTYKFYRMVFKIPKNADLADAIKVQKFIDNEHADTTYDPKYKGCYDDRPLEPGELSELNGIIKDSPWTEERMEKVYTKLYDGCEEHAEAHSELYKEMQALRNNIVGRPSPKMKRKMEEVEKKQDENWEWFKSFDRRVYLLHVQMAQQADADQKSELVERYRFQLEVQRLYQESRNAFNKADAYLGAYAAAARGEIQVGPDFAAEVIQVMRESWKALKNIIKDAKDINLPAMKNFEEGDNLADFILEGKMVPEPPLSYVKGVWIDKLMTQLQGVRQKCFRLHFKSVGGILSLQEAIATKWKQQREPVAAEVIDAEPVPAEVVPDEVVPAEVIPADVVPAEVFEAEVIAAEVLPDEPALAAPEPSKTMAAFVAQAPPTAPALPTLAGTNLRAPVAPVSLPGPEPVPAAPKPVPPQEPPPAAVAPAVEPVAEAPAEPPVAPSPPAPTESAPAVVEPVAEAPAEAPAAEPMVTAVTEPEPPTVAPVAEVREPEPPAPQPTVASPEEAEVIDADVVEAEVLDVELVPDAPAAKSTAPAEVFSLDSDEGEAARAPVPVKPAPKSATAAPVAAEEVFSLDSEDDEGSPAKSAPAEAAFSLDADDYKPKSAVVPAPTAKPPGSGTTPAAPPLSGTASMPTARTGAEPAVAPAPVTKPGSGKRPPIKITMVKLGEPSPLAR